MFEVWVEGTYYTKATKPILPWEIEKCHILHISDF